MEKEEIQKRNMQEQIADKEIITPIDHQKKKRIWIPILLMTIGTFLIVTLYFFPRQNKYILVKSLATWTNSIQKLTKNQTFLEPNWNQETIKVKGNINIDIPNLTEEKERIDFINKLSIEMNLKKDQINQKSSVAFKGDLEDKVLFDMIYTNQNKKQYLLLNHVLKRYLDLGPAQPITSTKEYNEQVEYVWNVFIKSMKRNIKSSYIKKTSEKITINEKNVSVNKITLVLNEKNMSELISNVLKDLKKDKKANVFITSLYPEFENFDMTFSEETNEVLYYSVYVKKATNEIVMVSIHDEEVELNHIILENDIFEIRNNQTLFAKAILSEEKDGWKVKIKIPSISKHDMTITQKIEHEKTTYQLTFDMIKLKINAYYNVQIKEASKNAYSSEKKLSVDISDENQKIMTLVLDMNVEALNEADIEEVKNAIKIDQLTEEEQQTLISHLEEIFTLFRI